MYNPMNIVTSPAYVIPSASSQRNTEGRSAPRELLCRIASARPKPLTGTLSTERHLTKPVVPEVA